MSTLTKFTEPPQDLGLRPPMIYVSEEPVWEYRHVVRNLAVEEAPGEDELNALGAEGWELVCTVAHGSSVHFYLKRVAR